MYIFIVGRVYARVACKKRNEDVKYIIRTGARESDDVPLVPFVQQTRHYRECNGRRTPAGLFSFSLFLLFFLRAHAIYLPHYTTKH